MYARVTSAQAPIHATGLLPRQAVNRKARGVTWADGVAAHLRAHTVIVAVGTRKVHAPLPGLVLIGTGLPTCLPRRLMGRRRFHRDGLATGGMVQSRAQGQHGFIGLSTGRTLALAAGTYLIL
jgi:hypothetical protein